LKKVEGEFQRRSAILLRFQVALHVTDKTVQKHCSPSGFFLSCILAKELVCWKKPDLCKFTGNYREIFCK